jgi:hypothetical protein
MGEQGGSFVARRAKEVLLALAASATNLNGQSVFQWALIGLRSHWQ